MSCFVRAENVVTKVEQCDPAFFFFTRLANSSLYPGRFRRYKGDNVINYSQRGGISVVTEKQTRTSRLLISRALPADSGNYTCAPSTAESASVLVHVLNGG